MNAYPVPTDIKRQLELTVSGTATHYVSGDHACGWSFGRLAGSMREAKAIARYAHRLGFRRLRIYIYAVKTEISYRKDY